MDKYWDEVWAELNFNEYEKYINGYIEASHTYDFIELFHRNNIISVCDAACGFGAYSVMLSKSGFHLSGFDVSTNSIQLTEAMLNKYDCIYHEYKICDITSIAFKNESFDGTVAHAVIDHLSLENAQTAINELLRITRKDGLLFLSFDGLSADDVNHEHTVLEDGSFLYSDGLLFRYYTEDDICMLLQNQCITHQRTNQKGDREIVLRRR